MARHFGQAAILDHTIGNQRRGVAKYLVQKSVVGAQPAVAWATADQAIDGAEGAIAGDWIVRRIFENPQRSPVEREAGQAAISEIGRINALAVGGYRQPAKLRGLASSGIDLDRCSTGNVPLRVDMADRDPVGHRIAVDEGARSTFYETDVEGAGSPRIIEDRFTQGAPRIDREDDQPVFVGRVGNNQLCRSIGIFRRAKIKQYVDEKKLLIGRQNQLGGDSVGLGGVVDAVARVAQRQFAGLFRKRANMVGSEGMEHEQRMARRAIGERLGRAAFAGYRFASALAIEQRKATTGRNTKALHRIVAAIGGKQQLIARGQDDAAGTFEGIGCAGLPADWLEYARPGTARGDALNLGQRAVGTTREMHDLVGDGVGLHVKVADHLCRRGRRLLQRSNGERESRYFRGLRYTDTEQYQGDQGELETHNQCLQ